VRADSPIVLRDGARLRLGSVVVTFRAGNGASTTETI
jgi:hypothetical protein